MRETKEAFLSKETPAQSDQSPGPCGALRKTLTSLMCQAWRVKYGVLFDHLCVGCFVWGVEVSSGMPNKLRDPIRLQESGSPPESPTQRKAYQALSSIFSLLGHRSGSPVPVGISRSHRKVLVPPYSLVLPQHLGVMGGGSARNGEQLIDAVL